MQGRLRADPRLADLRSANAAVVAIEDGAKGVAEALRAVPGVTAVEQAGAAAGFTRWRVTSKAADDVCPLLFDALRGKPWKLGELRPEPKTLERVFRDLADRAEVAS